MKLINEKPYSGKKWRGELDQFHIVRKEEITPKQREEEKKFQKDFEELLKRKFPKK